MTFFIDLLGKTVRNAAGKLLNDRKVLAFKGGMDASDENSETVVRLDRTLIGAEFDLRAFGLFSCRQAVSTGTVDSSGRQLTVPLAEDPGVGIDGWLALYGAGAAHGLSTPAAPTMVLTGSTGSARYRYSVIAVNKWGGCSAIGATAEVTDAPDTIDFSNYYSVQPASVSAAHTYLIVRETWNGSSYDAPVLVGKVAADLTTPQFDDFEVEDWSSSLPDPVDTLASFPGRNDFERRKVISRTAVGDDITYTLDAATTTKSVGVRVRGDNSMAIKAAREAWVTGGRRGRISAPSGYYPCVTGDLASDPAVVNDEALFFELVDDTGIDLSFLDWIPHHLPNVEQASDPNDDRYLISIPSTSRRINIDLGVRCNMRAGSAITASNGGADTWCNVHSVSGDIRDSRIRLYSEMVPMVLSELGADTDTHGVTQSSNQRHITIRGYGGSAHSQALLTNGGGSLYLDADCKGLPGTPWSDGIRDHSHVWRTNDPTHAQYVRITDQQWYGGSNSVGAGGKSSLLLGASSADVSDIRIDTLILERSYKADFGWPGVNRNADRFQIGTAYVSRTVVNFNGVRDLTVGNFQVVEDPFISGGSQPKLFGVHRAKIGCEMHSKWDLREHSQLGRECSNVLITGVGLGGDSGANISSADSVTIDMEIRGTTGAEPYALQAFGGTVSDLTLRGSYHGSTDRGLLANGSDVDFGQLKIVGLSYASTSNSGSTRTAIDLGAGDGDLYVSDSRFKHADSSGVAWEIVEHDGSSTGKITLRNVQLERPGSGAVNLISSGSNANATDTLEASQVYHGRLPLAAEPGDMRVIRSTTTALEDITADINTIGKYSDKIVINETTGAIVTAAGSTAGAVWEALDGTTAHTPV